MAVQKIQKTQSVPKHTHAGLVLTIIVLALAFIVCFTILLSKSQTSNANVALVYIDGVIYSGSGPGYNDGNTYSDDVTNLLNEIQKNKNIKDVVFEINSPGGSAVGSSEIASAIAKLRTSGKYTIALIREQGTSGAYWIASSCNKVYAHPLSITGSIGVLASYLEYGGLLERFNITYESLDAGIYKDTMSPYRNLSVEERALLQSKINMIYDAFVRQVAVNRNMSEDQVRKLATGMFYIGEEAKDLGLVDELGEKDNVVSFIEQKDKIKVRIKEYAPSDSLVSQLAGLQDRTFYMLGKGLGSVLIQQTALQIKA